MLIEQSMNEVMKTIQFLEDYGRLDSGELMEAFFEAATLSHEELLEKESRMRTIERILVTRYGIDHPQVKKYVTKRQGLKIQLEHQMRIRSELSLETLH